MVTKVISGVIEAVNGILLKSDSEGHLSLAKQGAPLNPGDKITLLSGDAYAQLINTLPSILTSNNPLPVDNLNPMLKKASSSTVLEDLLEEAAQKNIDPSVILEALEASAAGAQGVLGEGGNFYILDATYMRAGAVSGGYTLGAPSATSYGEGNEPQAIIFEPRAEVSTSTVTPVTTTPPPLTTIIATDSGLSATDRITNNGTINIGNLAPGSTWQFSTDGGQTWQPGLNMQNFVLPEGQYAQDQVQVRQTGPDGTQGPVTMLDPITVDTTRPDIVKINYPQDTNNDNALTSNEINGNPITVRVEIPPTANEGDMLTIVDNNGVQTEIILTATHIIDRQVETQIPTPPVGSNIQMRAFLTDLAGNVGDLTDGNTSLQNTPAQITSSLLQMQEDVKITANGQFQITDPDPGEAAFQPQTNTATTFGIFNLNADGTWNYDLTNNEAVVQQLAANEAITEQVTVRSADGTVHSFTIEVTGTNDNPIITAGNLTAQEDGPAVTGTATFTDVDLTDTHTFSVKNLSGPGTVTINPNTGVYTYDPGNHFQSLDAGQTASVTFDVTVMDNHGGSNTQTVTVTITGAEDAPVVSGTFTGDVSEDGTLTATGNLNITDVDTSDNPVSFADQGATLGSNGYGSFELVNGVWTYTLNNNLPAIQALDDGETLQDSITYTATDGTQQTITVTITGAEDAPVVSGTFTGDVSEDGTLTATGNLNITDVDTSDNPVSFADQGATLGSNGYGSFELVNGVWTYTLNNNLPAIQALDDGETLQDSITYTATDGTQQTITVTITGAEDAPVVSGTFTGDVSEDGTLNATGNLNITDVDTSDNPVSFADQGATLGSNGYGSFELVNGVWTYTLNNNLPAIQALDDGETLQDSITYTATDGTQQTITVTITGAEDAPVVSGTFTGDVSEDGTLTATGNLNITDVDTSDNPVSFADQGATLGSNGYGSFELVNGVWTYTLNNNLPAIQALDDGETLQDSITYTATDGTQQTITVTITGAEDAPVVSGTFTGDVSEDGTLTATGNLNITDVDTSDNPVSFADQGATLGSNGYGSFELVNGVWTYTLNNNLPAIQALDDGETLQDSITYTATDGTQQTITVTITGAEDAPVVSGTFTGDVSEDGTLTATGNLNITDVDTSDNPVSFADQGATLGSNGYGSFELVNGVWTYTLNNNLPAIQALDDGETLQDSITYTATDGTQQTITVTITGAEDAPVVSGTFTGDVSEDGTLTATGNLNITDVDTSDNPVSFADQGATLGSNGYGSFELVNGVWTYTLNNNLPAIQALDDGETLQDSITYTATDGTQQTITVTITGAEDAPVVSGTFTGDVSEDGTLTATGNLNITDVDTSDNPVSFADQGATLGSNGYGSFELVNGVWTYTLNNNLPAIQALDDGETLQDSITYTATDGTQQTITVTITGAEDAPVVSGTFTGDVSEDGTLTATGNLNITDVDTSDNPVSFADQGATLGSNGYGSFELVNGVWTYTLNNNLPAIQALDDGETLQDSITYTATDGTQQTITVTITGAEDAPVVSGTFTGDVSEDGTLTATGNLNITDVDTSDNPVSFADQGATLGSNGYGSFELVNGVWTYTLNNNLPAIQALDDGETLQDSITYTATDGTQQTITVTITGAEDAPVVSGTFTGDVSEDGTLTATGNLNITDVDTSDNPVSFADQGATLGSNGYGSFELVNGVWTYTLNNNLPAIQALDDGETLQDSITYTATDGTQQTITVTITGAEDAPVVSGTFTGDVSEDGTLTATGNLNITDVDTSDNPVSFADQGATLGSNGYGSFELVNGVWTYTLNNNLPAIQALDDGETLQDSITYTATDGTQQTITVTITGAEDAPVVSGTFTGDVSEDGTLTATGNLNITDVDTSDNPVSFADQGATLGSNGYGSFELVNGVWTYTLNNNLPAIQALDDGETLQDSITYTATDGTQQTITVTITGAEDAPVVSGTFTGDVSEDGTLTATGNLNITDVDTSDNPVSFADQGATLGSNGYGSFELVNGVWTYTLNNNLPAIQALDDGETLQDSITYTATDGTQQTITVTITGAEDAPVVSGTFTGDVSEDGTLTATGNLNITDVDTSDNPVSFADQGATLGSNGYGSFELVNGVWTYTLNNNLPAIQALDDGETLQDSITYTATDGTQQTITVTITGAEDAPVVSGTFTGDVSEDGTLTATGNLNITDVDTSDNPVSFADQGATLGSNGYGSFELVNGVWTYTLNNNLPAIQALDDGETLQDSITYTATDGTQQTITVTITGAEDAPVVSGTFTGDVSEDGTLTATGNLNITDVDTSDNPVSFADQGATLGSNGYGSFELVNGVWTYTLNNNLPAIQALDDGETLQDSITYTATDGTQQTITVTITGAEDAPVVSGTFTGDVSEDGTLTATGNLNITDVDTSDNPVSFADQGATLGSNGYGSFELVNGVWTYTLNNNLPAIQALDDGETLQDSITYTATDGTQQTITVTITGAEDAPVVSGTFTGDVSEDGTLTATGNLNITDVDTSDNPVSFADQGATLGSNGYGSFELVNGVWTYTLNNNLPAIQALDDGETLQDSITYTATDGTQQTITVTITGTNDAPIAQDATATGNEDTQITISLAGTDIDGTIATFTITSLPTNGTLYTDAGMTNAVNLNDVINATGNTATLYFQPNANWNGSNSFTYTATDNNGDVSGSATATITVNPVADAPILILPETIFQLNPSAMAISTGAGLPNHVAGSELGAGITQADLESELGIPLGTLDTFNPPANLATVPPSTHPNIVDARDGKLSTAYYNMAQGTTVNFNWSFLNGENDQSEINSGYNDVAILIITNPNGTKSYIQVSSSEQAGAGNNTNGTQSFTASTNGNYRFDWVIFNGRDANKDSRLNINSTNFTYNAVNYSAPISLTAFASLAEVDTTGTVSVTISGVPANAAFTSGTNLGGGVWSFTAEQLSGLHYMPPLGNSTVTLTVTATTTEPFNGSTASTTQNVTITVDSAGNMVSTGTAAGNTIVGTSANDIIHGYNGDDVITEIVTATQIAYSGTGNLYINNAGTTSTSTTNAAITIQTIGGGNVHSAVSNGFGVAGNGNNDINVSEGLRFTVDTAGANGSADFIYQFEATLSRTAGTSNYTATATFSDGTNTSQQVISGQLNGGNTSDIVAFNAPDGMFITQIDIIRTNEVTGGRFRVSNVNFDDDSSDIIHGGVGNDTIFAGGGNDLIYGGDGNDTIHGGAGNDTIYGGAGNDVINAGTGADLVDPGRGNNTVDLGMDNSADVLLLDFSTFDGNNTIINFDKNTDILRFDNVLDTDSVNSLEDLNALISNATNANAGADLTVEFSNGASVTFVGVNVDAAAVLNNGLQALTPNIVVNEV